MNEAQNSNNMSWAALGAGLASAGAGVANIFANAQNVKRQYKYATKLADYQNLINTSNYLAYNSPQALMKQYEQAGLNPNFAVGNATSAQGPGTVSQPQMPNIEPYNFDFLAQGVANAFNIMEQQSKVNLNNAKTENVEADTTLKGIDADIQQIIRDNKAEEIMSQIELNKANTAFKGEQAEQIRIDNSIQRAFGYTTAQQKLENLKKQGSLTDAQVWEINKQIEVCESMIQLNLNKAKLAVAQASAAFANAWQTYQVTPSIVYLNGARAYQANSEGTLAFYKQNTEIENARKVGADADFARGRADYYKDTGLYGNYGILNPLFHGSGWFSKGVYDSFTGKKVWK